MEDFDCASKRSAVFSVALAIRRRAPITLMLANNTTRIKMTNNQVVSIRTIYQPTDAQPCSQPGPLRAPQPGTATFTT